MLAKAALATLLTVACSSPVVLIGANPSDAGSPARGDTGAKTPAPPLRDAASPVRDGPMRDGPARDGSSDAIHVTRRDAGDDATMQEASIVDGASDAATEAPVFDPFSIAGLVLWLDAQYGVTADAGPVSAWADRTNNHNDATETTPALQPTLRASSFHGHPAVHFDVTAGGRASGNMLEIADAVTLEWGSGDFYVAVVARFDNVFGDGGPEEATAIFFSKCASTGDILGPLLTGNVIGDIAGPEVGLGFSTSMTPGDYVFTTTPYNDGTPHIFAMQRVGLTLDLRVDGVSLGTSTSDAVDVSTVGSAVRIGGDGMGQVARLDGDIAEIVAVAGTLPSSDRAALELFEMSKYGL